jgi:Zn finger protein HypA/HybF involved in hydrogenase expression
MEDWEIECLECGWRGMVADANHAQDSPEDEEIKTCPDCGSPEFSNRTGRNENA